MALEDYPKVYLYRRIVQSKLFMDNHYDEALNLDEVADEAYFSKFHFIRLFRKIYGKTPHQYLTSVRIERAKGMLEENRQVVDVCRAVGFESVSSFTELFKRTVGQTPSSYQLQQVTRKADIKTKPLHFIPNCFAEKHGWDSAGTKNSNFQEVSF